jgi:hypothetical protein
MSGSTKTSTQTTANSPWPAAEPYLEGAMQKASNLAEKGKGFGAYPGQTWTPYSSQTLAGLNTTEQLASQPNPFYAGNSAFTQGLVGGDYALDTSGYNALQNPSITTEADYRNMYNQVDPQFDQVVDTQAGKLTDDIARTFGGASYGSAANTGSLVDQVGDYRAQMASDQFNENQALQKSYLDSITGLQNQNWQNQFGLQNQLTSMSQMDLQNQLAGVGLSDQVYQSQYLPSDRMLGVGAAYDAKASEQLQAEMDKYNIQQQQPWNLLGAAYPYFSGTGGSTSTTTTQQPTDPWGQILGGGLLASQAFSPGGWLS